MGNDGGSATTAMTLDGASASVVIPAGKLNYDGTAVTATGAELNYLDITNVGTSEPTKAVTADGSGIVTLAGAVKVTGGSGLTVGAGGDEFTISESGDHITLAALVADRDMIFKVNDGGSATTAMTLDGASASVVIPAGKLNYDGTAVTATGAELNYLDITNVGTSEPTKAVTADGSGHVVLSSNLNAIGDTAIGDAATDKLTVTGETVFTRVTATVSADAVS